MVSLDEGDVVGQRYELGPPLGSGGMGQVRSGWDHRLGRPVAVKTPHPHLAGREDVRRRLWQEGWTARRLKHPNIVVVYDVAIDGPVPYLVMERVRGWTLRDELRSVRLDAEDVRRIGVEALDALMLSHSAGILHCDLKPSNLLLTEGGRVKLADFGVATATSVESEPDALTQEWFFGTLGYAAPEVLNGEPATVGSDVYSLGVVLYEALAGCRPFAVSSPARLVRLIEEGVHRPLGDIRGDLEPDLVAIIEQAMARRPADRFPSAASMRRKLIAALPDQAA